ncbi:MAG: hypothetical protein Q8S58_13400 [Bosea sp. (in: a-proteobacteria)]|nr:hypothetical protein [Bosea sp. (in: a-proteobacteria)]
MRAMPARLTALRRRLDAQIIKDREREIAAMRKWLDAITRGTCPETTLEGRSI